MSETETVTEAPVLTGGQWFEITPRRSPAEWHYWPTAAPRAACGGRRASNSAWTGVRRSLPDFPGVSPQVCTHCAGAYRRAQGGRE